MNNRLLDLIPEYGKHKATFDEWDKTCKAENAEIKSLMEQEGIDSMQAGGYKVSYSVRESSTMNESKLIEVLHKYIGNSPDVHGILKMKEVVDMEALESAIYNGALPKEAIIEMDNCRDRKQISTLRITKAKNKEEN